MADTAEGDDMGESSAILDRIDRYIDRSPEHGGCWLWTGALKGGYGQTSIKHRRAPAHRVVYELVVARIPDGMTLDHTCHTFDISCPGGSSCIHRRCVNPGHLEVVTPGENTRRGRRANVTHCPVGHAYALFGRAVRNVLKDGSVSRKRRCSVCHREQTASRRAAG